MGNWVLFRSRLVDLISRYVNDNVRFMLNYVETKYDDSVTIGTTKLDKIKALMLRSQISF